MLDRRRACAGGPRAPARSVGASPRGPDGAVRPRNTQRHRPVKTAAATRSTAPRIWAARSVLPGPMTQKQLADRTDMSVPVISRLERGDSDPRVSTVRRIADATGASLDAIINGTAVPAAKAKRAAEPLSRDPRGAPGDGGGLKRHDAIEASIAPKRRPAGALARLPLPGSPRAYEDVRPRCPSHGDEPGHRRGARSDPRPSRRDEPVHRTRQPGEDGPTMTTTLLALAAAALVVAGILPTGIG